MDQLQSRKTSTGKRLGFICTALEGDQVKFSWTKDGKIVLSGDRTSILSNAESSMLSIRDVRMEDRGNYTCIASNALSEDRTSARLSVEGELWS